MPAPTLRQIVLSVALVLASIIGTASFMLYLYRAEFFDLPGMKKSQDFSYGDSQQEPGNNARDALKMHWMDALVKAKPYSALITSETDEVLADGNRIRLKSEATFYRDSEGRLRLDHISPANDPGTHSETRAKLFIDDPVSKKSYIVFNGGGSEEFGSARSNEFLTKLAIAKGVSALSLPELDPDHDIQRTGLGVKVIEGMNCRGMREVITIPAGKIGNDRPILIESEIWYAPSIEAVVQSTLKDPRFGGIDYKLSNVRLAAQPAALFGSPIKTSNLPGKP